ncbi:lysoplasmalogenase family protein [Corynebacterium sp. 335C]
MELRKLRDAFVDRTREGLGALVSVVGDPRREPEILGYAGAWGVNVVSSLAGWETPRRTSKALLMPLLAAGVVRRRRDIGADGTATLLAGLAGAWLGDVLLMPEDPPLNRGSAAFTVTQLAHQRLMWRNGARPSAAAIGLRAPAAVGGAALVAALRPRFLPAAALYGPLLGFTGVLGDDRALVAGAGPVDRDAATGLPVASPSYGISHGANVFMVSDVILMARSLFTKPNSGIVRRAMDAALMDTYCLAQLLLVRGLTDAEIRRTAGERRADGGAGDATAHGEGAGAGAEDVVTRDATP